MKSFLPGMFSKFKTGCKYNWFAIQKQHVAVASSFQSFKLKSLTPGQCERKRLFFTTNPNSTSTIDSNEIRASLDANLVKIKSSSDSGVVLEELLSFEDHNQAFRNKKTWEIIRALGILRLCGFGFLVTNSLQIMTFMERAFGHQFLKTLVKPTFYKQFVGGENKEELAACIQQLGTSNIRPMLACTMETDVGEGMEQEDLFDKNAQKILDCLEFSSSLITKAPLMQLKVTGLLSADVLIHLANTYTTSTKALSLVENIANGMISGQLKMSELFDGLTRQERQCLEHAVRRFHKIGMMAQTKGVKVLVDAEYTYLNPAINLLTMALMAIFNTDSPVIWNTYQCYLKKALETITTEVEMSQKLGVCFGAKIVRGAYMVQEHQRAVSLGYPSPICENYEATNNNYNKVVKYMLDHVQTGQSTCNIIIATHNEESVRLAIRRVNELGIQPHLGTVNFGQLLGMSDQITFPLASAGFTVYKSIPYGPLGEVLPYLARRAMENQTVLAGARKEQQLLWQEIKSRAKNCLTPNLREIPTRTF